MLFVSFYSAAAAAHQIHALSLNMILIFQGLGDATCSSSHLLLLDLPVRVCISALQARCSFRH